MKKRALRWIGLGIAVAVISAVGWQLLRHAGRPTPPANAGPGHACVYSHARDFKGEFDAVAIAADLLVPSPAPDDPQGEWRIVLQIRQGQKWVDTGVLVSPVSGLSSPVAYYSTQEKLELAPGAAPGKPDTALKPGSWHSFLAQLNDEGDADVTIDNAKPVHLKVGVRQGLASLCLQVAPGQAGRGEFRKLRFQRHGSSSWWPMHMDTNLVDAGLEIGLYNSHSGRFTGRYQPAG